MPALLEKRPRTKPARRAAGTYGGGGYGRGGDGGNGREPGNGDGPGPRREWPLVPAVLVVSLLAVLLTLLGMYTQIQANLAGAQLPGS